MTRDLYVLRRTVDCSWQQGIFLKDFTEFDGASANFRVLPRFKIRSEGDNVLSSDNVLFLSEEATGQYLTHTNGVFSNTHSSDKHCFQVNDFEASASSAPRGWTVNELYKVSEIGVGQSKQTIHAGDVLQLSHREQGLLLAGAVGGFATMLKSGADEVKVQSLWQVCWHGPYTDISKVGEEGADAADRVAQNLNHSRRLNGGDIQTETESGPIHFPITLRNVLTGQYLSGPNRFNGLKSNARTLLNERDNIAPSGSDREAGGARRPPVRMPSRFDLVTGGYKEKWRNSALRIIKAIKKKKKLLHEAKKAKKQQPTSRAVDNTHYVVTEPEAIYGFPKPMNAPFQLEDLIFVKKESSTSAVFDSQMKLANDSQGGGFGSVRRTAFGFVPVDSQVNAVVDGGFYTLRNVDGLSVHFPAVVQETLLDSNGVKVAPPELRNKGSGSFEDVFRVSKVKDDVVQDVSYIQGLRQVDKTSAPSQKKKKKLKKMPRICSRAGGRSNPSMPPRCGSLQTSASADVRSSDDVIAC